MGYYYNYTNSGDKITVIIKELKSGWVQQIGSSCLWMSWLIG